MPHFRAPISSHRESIILLFQTERLERALLSTYKQNLYFCIKAAEISNIDSSPNMKTIRVCFGSFREHGCPQLHLAVYRQH